MKLAPSVVLCHSRTAFQDTKTYPHDDLDVNCVCFTELLSLRNQSVFLIYLFLPQSLLPFLLIYPEDYDDDDPTKKSVKSNDIRRRELSTQRQTCVWGTDNRKERGCDAQGWWCCVECVVCVEQKEENITGYLIEILASIIIGCAMWCDQEKREHHPREVLCRLCSLETVICKKHQASIACLW